MATHHLTWPCEFPRECAKCVLTIGNFDGVHVGHRALLESAKAHGKKTGLPVVALTFDPHPLQVLRSEVNLPLLSDLEDRVRLLQQMGAGTVLILTSTANLLSLRAREFFDEVIRSQLDVKVLVEGNNFGFGRGREGNVQTLAELCPSAGIQLEIVDPVLVEGKPVSSSRVRQCIESGRIREVTKLLGREYTIRGMVGVGSKRGSTLGFPTANLGQVTTLLPGDGVYAMRVIVDNQWWPAAANIGPNPTFGEEVRKCELHLIGFAGNLRGNRLQADFIEKLRDTREFKSVEALKNQIQLDILQAERIVGRLGTREP